MPSQPFLHWLKQQIDRNDGVGALARDVAHAHRKPRSLREWRFIERDPLVREAIESAVQEWRSR